MRPTLQRKPQPKTLRKSRILNLFQVPKGKITSWNDEKGFGFIRPSGGGKQVFIHINPSATATGIQRLTC